MSSAYFSRLTAIGAAEQAHAIATGGTLTFTHLAIGDGNGAQVMPDPAQQGLVHEVYRTVVNRVFEDTSNPGRVVVEAVIPVAIGGWTIREVGIYGNGGKFMVVGNFPATYKPLPAEGALRDQLVRVVIQLSDDAVVQLTVDGSVVIVTHESLAQAIADHKAADDPHPQYLNQARLASRLYFFGQL